MFNTECVVQHNGLTFIGYDDRIVNNVSTVGECIRICIHETSFICKSLEYISYNEDCYLSVDNTASVPDVKMEDQPLSSYMIYVNISKDEWGKTPIVLNKPRRSLIKYN